MPDRVTILADVAEIVSRSHDLDETLNNVVDLVAKRLVSLTVSPRGGGISVKKLKTPFRTPKENKVWKS